jgi:hypothetical protein
MSIKEIRELDKEVKEVSNADEGEDWALDGHDSGEPEEKNVEDEEDGEDKEEKAFSIGDTMLARGEVVENWGAKNLEDTVGEEDLDRDFGSEDFEEEEEEEGGFSYEANGGDDSGDLYGATVSSGDLYGGRDASAGDLYGATKRDDSVSMYNTGGGSAGESSLYSVGTTDKKSMMGVEYKVEGSSKKKSSVRRRPKSDLETGVRSKRRSKGVSLY